VIDPPIRQEIRDAQQRLWEHLARPGTWWTGAQRVAIAETSRAAAQCSLCRTRKAALSASAVEGRHGGSGTLADTVVDVAHRIRTDSGRLSRQWFDGLRDRGLEDPAYVELVAVVTMTAGFDYFARALGVSPLALPQPEPGEPSRRRPPAAKPHGAWLPTIAAADAEGLEADLYPAGAPVVPNIASALSLVPAEVRMLRTISNALYMPFERVPDPTYRPGPLDRGQMELVAARVSAMNQCFY
jgi:alkylhydroperoxidase family enzyme